jgi:Zn-dependent protease with chaperone function
MSDWRSPIFKWGLAGVYLVICSTPLLLFPRWAWPWLLIVIALGVVWNYWTWEESAARALDARPFTRWDVPDYPAFRQRLARGCAAAGLKREPIWAVTHSKACNAMAVGGRRGMVIFTTALLKAHPPEELLAIAAHELRHLADRDSLPGIVGGVWLRLFAFIAKALTMFRWTVPLGMLLGLLVNGVAWVGRSVLGTRSRHDEHMADLAGARLTSAATMIAALQRLHAANRERFGPSEPPAWSPLWITQRLHASHPASEQRVQFLSSAAERGDLVAH